MNKLIVKYSDEGVTVPDLKIEEWLDGVLADLETDDVTIDVGGEVMVTAVRCAINDGRLDHNNVKAVFNGEEIVFDEQGRTRNWPVGFCDTNTAYLEKLLGIKYISDENNS